MDYGDILKRAWEISWRSKALWVLGLFAGAGMVGSGSGSRYRADRAGAGSDSLNEMVRSFADALVVMREWGPVIIAGAVLAFLVACGLAAISVAAQGGLVRESDKAANGRPISAGEGWAFGFHHWGRIALVGLMLLGPLALLVCIWASLGVVGLVLVLSGMGDAVIPTLIWTGVLFLLLTPVLIVLGFVLTALYQLALRYAVLEERTASLAVAQAWQVLKSRFKDVGLMWVVMILLGIGVGIAYGIPAGILGGVGRAAALHGVWPVSAVTGAVLAVASLVLSALFGTFTSTAWTLFFGEITGRRLPTAQE